MVSFEYWFMFPVGMIIATIAMSTLVGGATFFSPFFILVLKLQPHIAIASALMIQFFGFTTGLLRYIKKNTIDYNIGIFLLLITIPYAIIGSYLSTIIPPYFIRILLGIIVIFIGYKLLLKNIISITKKGQKITDIKFGIKRTDKSIILKEKDLKKCIANTSIGSLFLGMTSAGLGELLGYNLIKKTNSNLRTIVSTTVFIIAITTLATSLTHFYHLFTTNINDLYLAFDILIFAVPGVILGAFVGTKIIYKINQELLQKIISIVLIITGLLCFIPF
ncbi:MAG: sulfite exporter TauE/SafE family protein [Candidatus Woesearchaeota archaeon]